MPVTKPKAPLKQSPDLIRRFNESLRMVPDGEKLYQCIQCGICGGSCPTGQYMDYSPRAIFGLLRSGYIEEALRSNTIWMCTSCYRCTVRCPKGIKQTEAMYALKYFAIKEKIIDSDHRAANMSRIFVNLVNRYGRNHETELIMRYFTLNNPLGALKLAPFGIKMFTRGRLPIMPTSIKGVKDVQAIYRKVEEMGGVK